MVRKKRGGINREERRKEKYMDDVYMASYRGMRHPGWSLQPFLPRYGRNYKLTMNRAGLNSITGIFSLNSMYV